MSALLLALRIARRDVRRHRGRSLLIVLMVGLPVLGLTTADVLLRSLQLSPAQSATRQVGTADAVLVPDGAAVPAAVVTARLGAGTSVASREDGDVLVPRGGGVATVRTYEADLGSPVLAGVWRLRSGRFPTAADEVAVSPHLAHDLGLRVGGSWRLDDPARTVRVVGTAVDPNALRDSFVLARPGALLPAPGGTQGSSIAADIFGPPTLLVSSPLPPAQLVARLDDLGTVQLRAEIEHPTPVADSGLTSSRGVVTVVAIGLGILQVVLLAGAAFAVGARRQVRDLALVAAAGGERRQVRAVVLAGGALLGLVGGVGGVALGVPLAAVLEPVAERYGQRLAGPFDVRPAEIALGTVIGLVAALLAAALPARTAARQDVVQALAGRRGVRGTPRALTVGGAAAVVVGAVVTLLAARPPAHASLVLTGAVLAELGFVTLAPALVGLAARGARYLPVAPRMALRDAARNRARSGPAVAAVLAALAGAVAVSTYLVSSSGYDRQTYRGDARTGQVTIYLSGDAAPTTAQLGTVLAALPTADVGTLGQTYVPCPASPRTEACPSPEVTGGGVSYTRSLTVGDDATLRVLLGRDDRGAQRALADGDAVTLSPGAVAGPLAVDVVPVDGSGSTRRVGTLSSYAAPVDLRQLPYGYPDVVVSAATAGRLGLADAPARYIVATTRMPTADETARATSALQATRLAADLGVERGYTSPAAVAQLALTGVAALVTIGAVAIATGLAAAEGRADLATLAAVGASPGVRRRLAMAQAAVVALLGAGLGVLAGLVPAVAVVRSRPGWPLVLPWSAIGVAVVAVPVLAALLAGVVTRSRLPLVGRVG